MNGDLHEGLSLSITFREIGCFFVSYLWEEDRSFSQRLWLFVINL